MGARSRALDRCRASLYAASYISRPETASRSLQTARCRCKRVERVMDTALGSRLDWNPYDYDLLGNPHDVFRRIREYAPLYYNAQYDFHAVSRYADCVQGLSD